MAKKTPAADVAKKSLVRFLHRVIPVKGSANKDAKIIPTNGAIDIFILSRSFFQKSLHRHPEKEQRQRAENHYGTGTESPGRQREG